MFKDNLIRTSSHLLETGLFNLSLDDVSSSLRILLNLDDAGESALIGLFVACLLPRSSPPSL